NGASDALRTAGNDRVTSAEIDFVGHRLLSPVRFFALGGWYKCFAEKIAARQLDSSYPPKRRPLRYISDSWMAQFSRFFWRQLSLAASPRDLPDLPSAWWFPASGCTSLPRYRPQV